MAGHVCPITLRGAEETYVTPEDAELIEQAMMTGRSAVQLVKRAHGSPMTLLVTNVVSVERTDKSPTTQRRR